MQPYTACVQINRLKLLVCGEKGVGKTALIHAFRDEYFTEDPIEIDETVCKVHYVDGRRILFQMVELHTGKLLPNNADDAQAIMLLFDDDTESTIKRIQEFWYSKINLYFSQVPLFLVRTKCDLRKDHESANGKAIKNSMHALKYLECSAKQMNGVKFVFLEVAAAVKPESHNKEPDDSSLTMTTSQVVMDVLSKIGSSGPLIRQIMVNLRECITNPAAFPDVKQSLCGIIPFNIFGVEPEAEVSNNNRKKTADAANEGLEKPNEKSSGHEKENEERKL